MTELEERLRAKIPGNDTGIEIRPSICAICSPDKHCGVDCYVKDGKIIKVEGTLDHPTVTANYVQKDPEIETMSIAGTVSRRPLSVSASGARGNLSLPAGTRPMQIIAENLNRSKNRFSSSVAFYSGHCKWYRFLLQRLAYSFGSVNYGTDDSNCAAATHLANAVTAGRSAGPDLAHANTFLGWNYSGYYSDHLSVENVRGLKDRGGKVIIIDTRYTPAAKNLADIFLQINPGTDGALALVWPISLSETAGKIKDTFKNIRMGFGRV